MTLITVCKHTDTASFNRFTLCSQFNRNSTLEYIKITGIHGHNRVTKRRHRPIILKHNPEAPKHHFLGKILRKKLWVRHRPLAQKIKKKSFSRQIPALSHNIWPLVYPAPRLFAVQAFSSYVSCGLFADHHHHHHHSLY